MSSSDKRFRLNTAVRVRPFSQAEKDVKAELAVHMWHGHVRVSVPDSSRLGLGSMFDTTHADRKQKQTASSSESEEHDRTVQVDHTLWSFDGHTETNTGRLVDSGTGRYASNTQVYKDMGQPVVEGVLGGVDHTLLVGGYAGTGKWHTCVGNAHDKGVFLMILEALLERVNNSKTSFKTYLSMVEVNSGRLNDLFYSESGYEGSEADTSERRRRHKKRDGHGGNSSGLDDDSSQQSTHEQRASGKHEPQLVFDGQQWRLETNPSPQGQRSAEEAGERNLERAMAELEKRRPSNAYLERVDSETPIEGVILNNHSSARERRTYGESGREHGGGVRTVEEDNDPSTWVPMDNKHVVASQSPKKHTRALTYKRVQVYDMDDVHTFLHKAWSKRSEPDGRVDKTHLVCLVELHKAAHKSRRGTYYSKLAMCILGAEEDHEKPLDSELSRLQTQSVNHSLSVLSFVLEALCNRSVGLRVRIPYQESTLTWLLRDTLQPDSHAAYLACVSPADTEAPHSFRSLNLIAHIQRVKTLTVDTSTSTTNSNSNNNSNSNSNAGVSSSSANVSSLDVGDDAYSSYGSLPSVAAGDSNASLHTLGRAESSGSGPESPQLSRMSSGLRSSSINNTRRYSFYRAQSRKRQASSGDLAQENQDKANDSPTYSRFARLIRSSGPRVFLTRALLVELRRIYVEMSSLSGDMDVEHFIGALQTLGLRHFVNRCSSEIAGMFQKFNLSRSGRLSFEEFAFGLAMTLRSKLEPQGGEVDMLWQICFGLFDRDQDGLLNKEEMRALLVELIPDAAGMNGDDTENQVDTRLLKLFDNADDAMMLDDVQSFVLGDKRLASMFRFARTRETEQRELQDKRQRMQMGHLRLSSSTTRHKRPGGAKSQPGENAGTSPSAPFNPLHVLPTIQRQRASEVRFGDRVQTMTDEEEEELRRGVVSREGSLVRRSSSSRHSGRGLVVERQNSAQMLSSLASRGMFGEEFRFSAGRLGMRKLLDSGLAKEEQSEYVNTGVYPVTRTVHIGRKKRKKKKKKRKTED